MKISVDNFNKKNYSPILSVVTVVRNGVDVIENTILSVINQSYSDIEYLIIDGKSTDGTLDIIKKYKNKIRFWISEEDEGIYDAMNKGISNANGKFVNFMNAGDVFINSDICKLFAEEMLKKDFNVIYADVIAQSDTHKSEILVKAKPLNKIWTGMIFSHQSAFIKLSNLKETPFDLKFKTVADFNQILSLYLNDKVFLYMPIAVSKVLIGGVSYSNPKTIFEKVKVIHSHKPYSLNIFKLISPLILSAIRGLFGIRMTRKIRKYKWEYFKSKGIKL
jgi:glycosyltransferase involved in cell wall biosynthesis